MVERAGLWGFSRADLQQDSSSSIMRFRRSGRRLEMFRASDSARMSFVDPSDRPTAAGGNAFDELRALTRGMNEAVLGLHPWIIPAHFAAPAQRRVIGAPPNEVVAVRRRIVETRFRFGELPGWGARLTVDFDDADRIQRITLIWRDQRVTPAADSVPLLEKDAIRDRFAKDFFEIQGDPVGDEIAIDGPGYLFAAPDEVQPWILPAYRARLPAQQGVPIKYYPACALDDVPAKYTNEWQKIGQ